MASEAPVYQGYEALNSAKREIRLLEIGPDLVCTLRHASLGEKPSYHALSYYWGAPGQELPITVNGEQVWLRKTLHRFFEVLQKHFLHLTVWVDAICINQRDRVEQSHQVSIMGDIYQQAASVYAWLGESDADSDFALAYIEQRRQGQNNADVEENVYRYLDQLFLRPYFTRSWIVQECALNDSIGVICGEHFINWESLHLAFRQTAKDHKSRPLVLPAPSDRDLGSLGWARFMRIQQARAGLSAQKPSIFEQVCNFGYTQCADPIDKVYAFRALSADSHKIQVGYTQPPLNSICQVLSSAYQDRTKASSCLYEQASKLLKYTSLTESKILPGLPPSPADILIESFSKVDILPESPFQAIGRSSRAVRRFHEGFLQDRSGSTLYDNSNHLGVALFSNYWNGTRYITPSQSSTEGAYLAIDLDSSGVRITQVHCLQREWLSRVHKQILPPTPSLRLFWAKQGKEPEAKLRSDLERMKPFRDICEGRIKLCRKAHRSRLASDKPNNHPDRVGAHISRVALMAFLACNASWDPCPESLVDYARQHPPTLDEAKCTCDVDMLPT